MAKRKKKLKAFTEAEAGKKKYVRKLETTAHRIVHQSLRIRKEVFQREIGMSAEAALTLLVEKGPLTSPMIARRISMARQTSLALLEGLIRKGLVEPQDNPDHGTAKLYAVTPKGRVTLQEMNDRWDLAFVQIAHLLNLKGLKVTVETMEAMLQLFDTDEFQAILDSLPPTTFPE